MYEYTDEGVHRDHPLGLQLAKGNMYRPLIRTEIVEAIIGKIGTFADAHSSVALQQEHSGGQIVAAEQFLLNELTLLRGQRAWQPLRSTRNVLAMDQMGQIEELRVPGKLLQYAAHKQQPRDIDRRRQVLGT